MRKKLPSLAAALLSGLAVALAIGTLTAQTGQPGRPGGPGGPGGPRPQELVAPVTLPPDTAAAERDSLVKVVLDQIKGREDAPAESVFKNVKVMKNVPAGRLVHAMDSGFGHSLGVGCGYCHVVGKWDKDDKPKKQVARDMMAMGGTINFELLPKIKNLDSERPGVSCTTCHRGQVKPATRLP